MLKHLVSLVAVLTTAFVVLTGCVKPTYAPLKFYIVSEQPLQGGNLIDTATLPKVGYISATPDMIVTNILDVYRDDHSSSTLTVVLHPADAILFGALTGRAIYKRLLVSVGDTPVTAPRVMSAIPIGRFVIEFASESDRKKIQPQLENLVSAK